MAKQLETLCRDKLLNINFIWQYRVKGPDSLEEKLRNRSSTHYTEADKIRNIRDLIGARIVLARYEDIRRVEGILKGSITVVDRTQHPKAIQNVVDPQTRFRGYSALHIYVKLQNGPPDPLSNPVIEIQLMTGFMWEFSQLHHDVDYKRLNGEPTEALLAAIDMLKGIANLGEAALQEYDKSFLGQEHYPNVQSRARSVFGEEAYSDLEVQSQSVVQPANSHREMGGVDPGIDTLFDDPTNEEHAYAIMRQPTANREAHEKDTEEAHRILLSVLTTSSQIGFPPSRRLRILRNLALAERRSSSAKDLDTGVILKHLDQAEGYMDEALGMPELSEAMGAKEQITMERQIVQGLKAKVEFQRLVRNEEATRAMLRDAAAGIRQALKDLERVDTRICEQSTGFANKWIIYFKGV